MNLTDFTEDIAKEFNLSKKTSKAIITFLNKKMRDKIIFGISITLREIGTFNLRKRLPKPFLNFTTNKMDMSKKSYYLDFQPTDKMKKKLKEKTVH